MALNQHLIWTPVKEMPPDDENPRKTLYLAASQNAYLDNSHRAGVKSPWQARKRLIKSADPTFKTLDDLKHLLDNPFEKEDAFAIAFSNYVAMCSGGQKITPQALAKKLDMALADPVLWAQDRPLLGLSRLYSPQMFKRDGAPYSQMWITNCGRFVLYLEKAGSWNCCQPHAGELISLARAGVAPELWTADLAKETSNRISASLWKLGQYRTRRELLQALTFADEVGKFAP